MAVNQFKFKREQSLLKRQQTRLWQVVDVELPYIDTKRRRSAKPKYKHKHEKEKDSAKQQPERPKTVESPTKVYFPEIVVNAKTNEVKRRNLPQDRTFVRQLTNLKFPTNRKTDREKRAPLKGWETDGNSDDGIVGWAKRQNLLESKRGTKKQPPALDADHYFPVQHRCPNIEDAALFVEESLHAVFHPKQKKINEGQPYDVKLRLTNGKFGVLTPAGFLERDEADDGNYARQEIHTYRDTKATTRNNGQDEKRCQSVQDLHTKSQLDRSNTYLRIKRLLKFSKNGRKPAKNEDDEDEGYSSKTSSAEHKTNAESDGEDSGSTGEKLDKQRMFSSMVDLTELPSNASTDPRDHKTLNDMIAASKGKFNYTHQPTILQLPNPDIELTHDRVRIEKKIENEDSNWSYAKLKRSKELNRCYKPELISPPRDESTTVYNIDAAYKPMTLVLRKISIQNAGPNNQSVYHTSPHPSEAKSSENNATPRNSFTPISRAGSALSCRAGSSMSRAGSAMSRAGSRAGSRASSAMSGNGTPRMISPQDRQSGNQNGIISPSPIENKLCAKHIPSNVRDVRVVDSIKNDTKSKEPMWAPQYSFLDRQTTNYCIGDLLPAVDKNIYTNRNSAKRKFGNAEEDRPREEMATSELIDFSKDPPVDDGYLLLKKGMDMLTGGNEKPTLGPPPFRPNQSRHPLMRNLTVVVNNRQENGGRSSSPPSCTNKTRQNVRVNSAKGLKQLPVDEDRETQKKLKEAFTQFYRNRPKEVGKEFRRMQTMWKT